MDLHRFGMDFGWILNEFWMVFGCILNEISMIFGLFWDRFGMKSADPLARRRVGILRFCFSFQYYSCPTPIRFYLDSATLTTAQQRYSQTPRLLDSIDSQLLRAFVTIKLFR